MLTKAPGEMQGLKGELLTHPHLQKNICSPIFWILLASTEYRKLLQIIRTEIF